MKIHPTFSLRMCETKFKENLGEVTDAEKNVTDTVKHFELHVQQLFTHSVFGYR